MTPAQARTKKKTLQERMQVKQLRIKALQTEVATLRLEKSKVVATKPPGSRGPK